MRRAAKLASPRSPSTCPPKKMPDIVHDFPIKAPPSRVFAAITTPADLDEWWTRRSSGEPKKRAAYELWFGEKFEWRARVTKCVADREFELDMTRASPDWLGTKVGFRLTPSEDGTAVQFYHSGWRQANEHMRTSSFCWAMYLRILKRFLEHGEIVPYERRLHV